MAGYPIDIVVPWVDGSDPAWRAERAKFRPDANSDNSEARYREWGLFHFWFRSIEKYAPWVNKIHLITWGHLPPWLNTNHPKLHIVNHKDYIPEDSLPTFNAIPIENNVHRIPDLAEHFILFNDDLYLSRPTLPEDFFIDGNPVDSAVLNNVTISDSFSVMPYLALNCLGIINENFSKRTCLKNNAKNWFSLKYGKLALYNFYYSPGRNFPGFRNFHSCVSYCKSTFKEVWEKYPELLARSNQSRFRSREDINHYLFRYWRLAQGAFVAGKPNCAYLTVGEDSVDSIGSALDNKKFKVVCINDDPSSFDFETEQQKLYTLLQKKFPEPSDFEIKNEV